MTTALMIILSIICVLLVLAVILQQGESNGLSALTGNTSDTSYGRKKSSGYNEKLSKITIIMAIAFIIINLILVVIM